MITRPENMDFTGKRFTVIIAGAPGLGKTTLALSAPAPFLFDTDQGISRVSAEHRGVTSQVTTYEGLLEDINTPEYKAAQSIIIDTGGSLVQLMKDWAKKQDPRAAKNGMAMFGVIKQEFDRLIYQFRVVDQKNVVIVFHTTETQKGDVITTRLSCEGSSKDIVWTPADFGGYMFMQNGKRVIGFTPTEEYFAKGCYGVHGVMSIPVLTAGVKNDFLTRLFETANASIAEEASVYAVAREAYAVAMEQGKAIVDTVNNADTATAAVAQLKGIQHALTSKEELVNGLFVAKCKELGLKWDKAAQKYV